MTADQLLTRLLHDLAHKGGATVNTFIPTFTPTKWEATEELDRDRNGFYTCPVVDIYIDFNTYDNTVAVVYGRSRQECLERAHAIADAHQPRYLIPGLNPMTGDYQVFRGSSVEVLDRAENHATIYYLGTDRTAHVRASELTPICGKVYAAGVTESYCFREKGHEGPCR